MDAAVNHFLAGKSEHTRGLFGRLIAEFEAIGDVRVNAAKSMICIGRSRNFAYVIYLGKNFIDVVLPFKQTFAENFCFKKIKQVPGSPDFNHHLRIYHSEDFNDEVRGYMKLAWQNGCNQPG